MILGKVNSFGELADYQLETPFWIRKSPSLRGADGDPRHALFLLIDDLAPQDDLLPENDRQIGHHTFEVHRSPGVGISCLDLRQGTAVPLHRNNLLKRSGDEAVLSWR